MVERSLRQLKDALRARTTEADWPSHLPWVILGLRAAPKLPPRRICASPQLSSSTVFLWYFLASFLVSRSRRQRCSGSPQGLHLPTSPPGVPAPPRSPKRSLSSRSGAKPPLSPAYSGPFAVVSRSPKFSVLDLGERHQSVSVDWLKPHAGASIFTPAAAPRRGRPPLPVAPPEPPPGGGGSVDA